MPDWIVTSIVLSVVATILINVLVRIFPTSQAKVDTPVHRRLDPPRSGQPRVKIWFPWKLMIGLSVAATVLLNTLLS
ncbi:MAG: hypothetical protein KJN63_06880 [Acidimicrobiia bacterium]|nr:hypothetical protein [Acidimicrobiia bacterium]